MDLLPDFSPEQVLQLTWSECQRACKDRRHPFRFFSMSTTDGQKAYSRTVVLRDLPQPWTFRMYTDARSQKMAHLQAFPHASLLFYHPKRQVQLIVQAKVSIHQADEIAQSCWPRVHEKARKDYQSTNPPASPIAWDQSDFAPNPDLADEHFVVLDFKALKMDLLQLRREGHLRYQMAPSGTVTRVQP